MKNCWTMFSSQLNMSAIVFSEGRNNGKGEEVQRCSDENFQPFLAAFSQSRSLFMICVPVLFVTVYIVGKHRPIRAKLAGRCFLTRQPINWLSVLVTVSASRGVP